MSMDCRSLYRCRLPNEAPTFAIDDAGSCRNPDIVGPKRARARKAASARLRALLLAGTAQCAALACAALAAMAPGPAAAQNWNGSQSTDWTDASNWSGGVPAGGDVTINTTTPNPTVLGVNGAENATVNNIRVGSIVAGDLTIQSGSTLTTTTNGYLGGFPNSGGDRGPGTATVTGANSLWSVGNELFVNYNGTATLNIEDGGTVSVAGTTLVAFDFGPTPGTVNITTGGTLETLTLQRGGTPSLPQLNFDGGIVRALADNSNFITGFSGTELNIEAGGLTIDDAGFEIGVDSPFSGPGGLTKTGSGDVRFNANSTFSGGLTVTEGTAIAGSSDSAFGTGTLTVNADATADLADNDTTVGGLAGAGNVTLGSGLLTVNQTGNSTYAGVISGTGGLELDNGTLTLTGSNTYTGDTTIFGTLQLGNGGATGSIVGDIDTLDGALIFNRSNTFTYDGDIISGSGTITQAGTGTTVLNGDSNLFGGSTAVNAGTLTVHGTLGGTVNVASGGALGGDGTIVGDTTIASGGTLIGRQGHQLNFGSDLALASGTNVNVSLGAPETTGLFNVAGDLTLDGTLNVTDLGGFGTGLYRLFNYDGNLADNGLEIGTVPAGIDQSHLVVQTAPNEVNLISASGVVANFWDGADPTNHNNGSTDGTDGVWQASDFNWAPPDGVVNWNWENGHFAIFTGTPGTVTVDASQGAISVAGMQFAVDGYRLEGDSITLERAETIVRTGFGHVDGEGVTATIASELTGSGGLVKTDFGTLVLTGTNTYTGGTVIHEGTLQLGDGGTSGSIVGDVANNGTLAFNRSDASTFDGTISGTGSVEQSGTGTTALTADNTYTGGTTISDGTLQLGDGGTTGSIVGDVTNDGTLVFKRSNEYDFGGTISGSGAVVQDGTGTTVFNTAQTYTGPTTINAGTLLVNGSTTSDTTVAAGGTLGGNGTVGGDVTNSGIVSPGNSIGTLTIDGDYVGTGGTLLIESVLGDSSSPADLLVVTGNVSGNTAVQVENLGGMGAQTTGDGIRIVEVGGTSTDDAFSLAEPVRAGAFTYDLFLGGLGDPDDWFLRSTGLRPAAAVYPIVPSLAQEFGARLLGTLHRRVGAQEQLRCRGDLANCPYGNGGWGRVIGVTGDRAPGNPDEGAAFDYDLWAVQAGRDLYRMQFTDGSREHAGLYFAGGGASAKVLQGGGTDTGDVWFGGYALGGYWTWYGANQWYLDAVLQSTWYDVRATTSDGDRIEPTGWGGAASLEGGYPLYLRRGWILEPQAQLLYQGLNFGTVQDAVSTVSISNADSLRGRVGLRLAQTWCLSPRCGAPRLLTVALTGDAWREFEGDNLTTLAALDGSNPQGFLSDLGGSWGEIGGEATAQLNRYTSLYGSGQYARGFDGDRDAWTGSVGLRVNW